LYITTEEYFIKKPTDDYKLYKKLTKVYYSHYPCEKPLMERVFVKTKDFFTWGTEAIMTGCSS